MLARIESEKRNESSNTTPICSRSDDEGDVANVDAVDPHRALVHVVEAGEQQSDGRLPRSGGADERDRLAGLDGQREVAQHRLRVQVAERDVVEAQLTAGRRERDRIGLLLHERGAVEQVGDPLGAGAGELADGQDRREHPDRGNELQHVDGEREERRRA